MRLVASDGDGVFTFKVEDTAKEVIFVKGTALVADTSAGHCSSHKPHYFNGCDDCKRAVLLNSFTEEFSTPDLEEILTQNKANRVKLRKLQGFGPQLKIELGEKNDPRIQLIHQQLSRVFAVFFQQAKNMAAKAAGKAAKKLKKDAADDKRLKEEAIALALAAYAAIQWDKLYDSVVTDLLAAAQVGAQAGLMQVGITDGVVKDQVNKVASAYAEVRAKELVTAGAHFTITDPTKDDLADVVEKAVSEELTIEQIEERIKMAGTFSDVRAKFIAKNELALAQVKLHLEAWKISGKIKKINVVLSTEHKVEDECDEIAGAGPYDIDKVPSIPTHPNCMCSIVAIEE